jgi:hypothetical protein
VMMRHGSSRCFDPHHDIKAHAISAQQAPPTAIAGTSHQPFGMTDFSSSCSAIRAVVVRPVIVSLPSLRLLIRADESTVSARDVCRACGRATTLLSHH